MNKVVNISLQSKWQMVKNHYENSYSDYQSKTKWKFKARPSDDQIDFLYDQMMKLYMTERKHNEREWLKKNS